MALMKVAKMVVVMVQKWATTTVETLAHLMVELRAEQLVLVSAEVMVGKMALEWGQNLAAHLDSPTVDLRAYTKDIQLGVR